VNAQRTQDDSQGFYLVVSSTRAEQQPPWH
jgi:hypothetical protein